MRCRFGRSLVAVLLLPAVLAACGDEGADDDSEAVFDLPVITPDEALNGYTDAGVRGQLQLEKGCLLIDGHVAFWPKGTTWDGDTETVVSDGEVLATVGEDFHGAGGYYDGPVDYRELLGEKSGDAMEGCLDVTGAAGAVLAYKSE